VRQEPNIEQLLLAFAEGQARPANEHVQTAQVELPDGSLAGVLAVAQEHGRVALNELAAKLQDGDCFEVRVVDRDGHWRALHAGGAVWPAPKMLVARVRVRIREQLIATTLFRTEDGVEALTSEVPMAGVQRQVTIVARPDPSGGKQLTIAVGDPRPKATNV
jgi:hypothetical protein